jgi:transcriptional regulator with XRE-family HTH domain
MEDEIELEIRRLSELLETLIRIAKRSRRSLEAELGLGSSGLSKILKGTVRLQLSHILSILGALRVDPYDFFRAAYDRRRLEKSPLVAQLRAQLDQEKEKRSGEEEPQNGDAMPELEESVRKILLKLLTARTRGDD